MPSNCSKPLVRCQETLSWHGVGQLCVDSPTGHAAEYDSPHLHCDLLLHIIFNLIGSEQVNSWELKRGCRSRPLGVNCPLLVDISWLWFYRLYSGQRLLAASHFGISRILFCAVNFFAALQTHATILTKWAKLLNRFSSTIFQITAPTGGLRWSFLHLSSYECSNKRFLLHFTNAHSSSCLSIFHRFNWPFINRLTR